MAVFNGAFPILPGKEAEAKAFAEECAGARSSEFAAMQKGVGTARETWSLQQTPMGSFMLVWFEAPDVEHVFADLATSTDDFAVWFRGQVLAFTGVDLSAPDGSPPPEVVLTWP